MIYVVILLCCILVYCSVQLYRLVLNEVDGIKSYINYLVGEYTTDTTKKLKSIIDEKTTKFSDVSNQLSNTNVVIAELSNVMNTFKQVLTNSQKRGDLGEKLADDIIKHLGFIENVNYFKQQTQANGKRPDFTFLLPNELKVNMDSKFPLDNYLKYIRSKSEVEEKEYLGKFIKDIKNKIKDIHDKYIDLQDNTVDFAIMFLGSDSMLTFITDNCFEIVDYAFENKIIMCSPITLYLVLRVFYQINYMYNLDANVLKALNNIEGFKKELIKYLEEQDKFDVKLNDLCKIRTNINTTRYNQLEKVLDKIDS